jgi:CubicO group peptidase (beta-lactamase class C family)
MIKQLLLILFSFLSIEIIAQTIAIPQKNWELAETYLGEQKELSGMVMLGEHGKIKINRGFGYANRDQKIPFTDQTLYTIGSITKPFTATAILLLYADGKLSTEDQIDVYFEKVPDDKKHITIHQLLTHSSGLPGAIGDDYAAISDLEFQQSAWEHPLSFIPGTGYDYSNVGYSLLGMIIEKVSGENYSDFVREHILIPAGMKTAGYQRQDVDYHLLAHGYLSDGTDWGTSHDKNWNGAEPYWHLKANGGLLMSARDMYQWYLALRENKVLSPALLKMQTTPYADEGGGSFYGYGYVVDQDGECVQHNGGNRIFKADFRWYPKADIFLFAATNDANVRLFKLNDEIMQILMTGKLPVADVWEEIPASTFPANANQKTAKAFIDMLNQYSNEKANIFIPQYCSTEMLSRNGEERLKEIFNMLHEDGDHTSAKTIYTSGGKILIKMRTKQENAHLKITLTMVDHKIDKLSAEIEGI